MIENICFSSSYSEKDEISLGMTIGRSNSTKIGCLTLFEKNIVIDYADKYDREYKKTKNYDYESMRSIENIDYLTKSALQSSVYKSERYQEISKDVNKEIYDFVRDKTRIGETVKSASLLKTRLNEKKSVQVEELDEILKF